TRPWHIHIDNYGNYMSGYCGGLSLGDAERLATTRHIDLEDKPVLAALVTDIKALHELAVEDFDYKELEEGYVSKCHLCVDIRKHIARQTEAFTELRPREFYQQLTS
ncbi:MAG: radical SAM protein, partial [Candidatus Bathyarchaeota archaeon]|nr:radical SAM protein [Candidatus Bathyarchaeota archaeon]